MPRHDDPTEIEPRPTAPPAPGARSTVDQLRSDIDAGATGDKVPVLDPAASPLGTDDEAGGASPSPALVAEVRRTERKGPPLRSPLDPTDPGTDRRHAWRLGGGLALLVALGIAAALVGFAGG